MAANANVLNFEGSNYLRQRLVLSTLSGRSIKIKKIRYKDESPGLNEYEANFLKLLDKITNGSTIEINETGSAIYYQPGMLIGGHQEHECNLQRSIGYYLESILCLAPFCKAPLDITLKGVTNDRTDPSVDMIKLSSLPVLKRFIGTDEGLELKIIRRGAAPGGGGEVLFKCPVKPKLRPFQYLDPGKIKRIRGTAWSTRVSPATCNRIVDAARSILNKCLPDIYIYTDHSKGSNSGRSPGFGLTLTAETINGTFLSAEICSNPKGSSDPPSVPEDIGKNAAILLLKEIYNGGCVDTHSQSLACLMMVLGDKDVSKVQTGMISPYTIQLLRHIRDFFQVVFKIDEVNEDEENIDLKTGGNKYILTSVGVGYRNMSKVLG